MILKEGAGDHSALAGAVFEVSTSQDDFDNHIVDTLTTDASGYTPKSKDLQVGDYWVKEAAAPAATPMTTLRLWK